MSATKPVDSTKNRFLKIHESKLKSVKKIQIADSFLNVFRPKTY